MHRYGIRGRLHRLLYNLNKDIQIYVKRKVGTTDYTEVRELVGQETNEGAVISAINLDGGVTEEFEDSKDEVEYLGLKIKPCFFKMM